MPLATAIEVDVERDVEMTTRDGVVLRSDVYRPRRPGPHPVLLLRTPYDREYAHDATYLHPIWYARQGFIVVVQDVRGRFSSDGAFVPFESEGRDGFDTVEWAAGLDGSNGRVGMYGASYPGAVQFMAAVERPPHLCAIAPAVAGADCYANWTYEGGALNLAFVAHWCAVLAENLAARQGRADIAARAREIVAAPAAWFSSDAPLELEPLREITPFYVDWLTRDRDDSYWRGMSAFPRLDRVSVPVLHVTGWYDIFLENCLATYEAIRSAAPDTEQWLLIGPWAHYPHGIEAGHRRFGPDAQGTGVIDSRQIEFFRHFLDGGPAPSPFEQPPVRFFVLFENRWDNASKWPPKAQEDIVMFLRSEGGANTLGGDGRLSHDPPDSAEPPDVYQYYPAVPVPAAGGHSCCDPAVLPMGCRDQTSVEQMPEVLVYTSAAFERPATFAGELAVDLYVATDAVSADYALKLCVVDGSGSWNVAEGIRRFNTDDLSMSRDPDGVVRAQVALRSAAFRVSAGERLRLEVTGGAFPTYDRNPQSGASPATAGPHEMRGAFHLVFHDERRLSSIRLWRIHGTSP